MKPRIEHLSNEPCDKCKKTGDIRQETFYSAGEHMIVYLQRDQSQQNTPININEEIEIQQDTAKRSRYQLHAFIDRYSDGTNNAGHFVCTKKKGGRWYKINDDKVTEMNDKSKMLNENKKVMLMLYKKI